MSQATSSVNNNEFIPLPQWYFSHQFVADTTYREKIGRVFNACLLAASMYSAYALIKRSAGIMAYITMGLVARKVVSVIIGYCVYHAVLPGILHLNWLVPGALSNLTRSELEIARNQAVQALEKSDYIVKRVSLYKSGTKFDAYLISHPDTMSNGNWSVHALGNGMALEEVLTDVARDNFSDKCNTLLINGPSVGFSGGWPTRHQLGAGFEAGIQFLEKKIQAKKVIMKGLSLGGGMMGEAVLNHDFEAGQSKGIHYLFVADRTFDTLSAIASAFVGRIAKLLFFLTGMELDGVAAANSVNKGLSRLSFNTKVKITKGMIG